MSKTWRARDYPGQQGGSDDRDRQFRFDELLVDPEDAHRFILRFGLGFVRRVSFLPEEFGRPQEWPRDLFPSDHVRPLVDQDG